MLKTVCDRCEKVLENFSTHKKLEITTKPISVMAIRKDLCMGCFKELEVFLSPPKGGEN